MEHLHNLLQRYKNDESCRKREVSENFFQQLDELIVSIAEAATRKHALPGQCRDEIRSSCHSKVLELFYTDVDRLLEVSNWGGWIFRMVQNLVHDEFNAAARRRKYIADPLPQRADDNEDRRNNVENHASSDDAKEELQRKIDEERVRSRVRQEVENIEDPLRRKVFLLYLDCYTQKQIAAQTELPITTVNNWIDRIKKQLVVTMRQYCEQEGIIS